MHPSYTHIENNQSCGEKMRKISQDFIGMPP